MLRAVDVGRLPVEGRIEGVRALLLDMDGVLLSRGLPIPGAAEAVARLTAAPVPFRVVTNTSLSSRTNLARRLGHAGIEIAPERIVTALSATVAHLRDAVPGGDVYLLGSGDAASEFAGAGLRLMSGAELDGGARADAVVIGDSEDQLTYENLNRAFRQIRAGAAFVAMHRNPWWLTAAGPTLDSGSLVVGLEYATGRQATVAGKPSPQFFRAAFADLAAEVPGLRRAQVAMVGDDLWTDLAPARRIGMRAALVLTGRHRREDLVAATRRGGRPFVPDVIAASIRELADELLRPGGAPGPE